MRREQIGREKEHGPARVAGRRRLQEIQDQGVGFGLRGRISPPLPQAGDQRAVVGMRCTQFLTEDRGESPLQLVLPVRCPPRRALALLLGQGEKRPVTGKEPDVRSSGGRLADVEQDFQHVGSPPPDLLPGR